VPLKIDVDFVSAFRKVLSWEFST